MDLYSERESSEDLSSLFTSKRDNTKGKRFVNFSYIQYMYNPKTFLQTLYSKFSIATFPYLAYFTTRHQIEELKIDGMRYEDTYYNRFWRENYVSWHIFAQNFHPESLLERTRDINFFRKPDALFKGFAVPEWAQSSKREGYQIDFYARKIWDKAINEARYEQTPAPQKPERLGPNIIQAFRIEDYAGGNGARLFYNEDPKPTFYRYKGRFEEADKERLHSFKDADQPFDLKEIFGADPDTPEGKKKLENIFEEWRQAMPWLFEEHLKVHSFGVKE